MNEIRLEMKGCCQTVKSGAKLRMPRDGFVLFSGTTLVWFRVESSAAFFTAP